MKSKQWFQWLVLLFKWAYRCDHKVYLVGGGKLGCIVCGHEIELRNGKWVKLKNKWDTNGLG
jgi:hypothetical protein